MFWSREELGMYAVEEILVKTLFINLTFFHKSIIFRKLKFSLTIVREVNMPISVWTVN